MRLPQSRLQQLKNYIHISQAVVLFFTWAVTIAVLTRDGKTDSRTGWYFGLCWLSIPILIYLTMVPIWSRARRFSNVYVFATLDGLSALLWLSAWAAVASYVVSGKGAGDKKEADGSVASGCDNFSHGSAGKCKLSEATIVFGVLIMLGFCATAFVSFHAVMHFKRTGLVPNPYSQQDGPGVPNGGLGGVKPTSQIDVQSTNSRHAHVDDEEEEAAFDPRMDTRNQFGDEDDEDGHHYGPRQTGTYSHLNPDTDTAYAPAHYRNDGYDDLSGARQPSLNGPLYDSR